jgi:hypothetical protein
MTTLSIGKRSVIAATVASLAMLATVTAQSAIAADFKASGKFADSVNFGDNPVLLNLQGGSFDGTYSMTGLPSGSAPVVLSNWLFNLRDSSGTIQKQFSDAFGDGAGAASSSGKDSLFFGNGGGYLLLDFASGFTGIGLIQTNPNAVTRMSSKTVAEATFDPFVAATELDIVSGRSEAIPTPALLPGLIGLSVAALRKRRGVQPSATEV